MSASGKKTNTQVDEVAPDGRVLEPRPDHSWREHQGEEVVGLERSVRAWDVEPEQDPGTPPLRLRERDPEIHRGGEDREPDERHGEPEACRDQGHEQRPPHDREREAADDVDGVEQRLPPPAMEPVTTLLRRPRCSRCAAAVMSVEVMDARYSRPRRYGTREDR